MKDNDVKIVNDDSITDIVKVIETHRENAYRKVNEELVTMYYEILRIRRIVLLYYILQ